MTTVIRAAFLFLAAACLFQIPAEAQVYEGQTLVKASLVADSTAITPGKPVQVGLLLQMAPTWHTYWQYAGDAGIPTKIDWALPDGFTAGSIQWPLPEAILEPGDIQVYAYGDKVLLITQINVPATLATQSVTFKAKASWLVCADICVPGSANVELTLPVSADVAPANRELFDEFRKQLPASGAPPFGISWSHTGTQLQAKFTGLGNASKVELFPIPNATQVVGHPPVANVKDGTAQIAFDAPADLHSLVVVQTGSSSVSWLVSSVQSAPAQAASTSGMGGISLALALFYGFLGGLILNLMPCVLPVISLKIFGFIQQAGEDRWKIFSHGLAFAAGVFVWFLGLAVVIVGLKSAGHEVTWAFQFQNPWFNVVICTIVFVFALNLFGVFEIVLPGRATTALADAGGGGYAGSFFQGVFATLLATPCTAPFLGTALGFAFSQSSIVILAMFASVATGMAFPYLLLSGQPGWMKLLPKPGLWMEQLKQFMGFPLLATLLWLLYILGKQRGLEGMLWVGCFLLSLAVACWVYGAFCGPISSTRSQVLAIILVLVLEIGGGWYFLGEKFTATTASSSKPETTAGGIDWVPFSQAALDADIAAGKPVFVDFTADWCITCKFNERTAINVPSVQEAFKENGIVAMKADWTNPDPEITAALKKFGRVGVPFYVLYPAGRGGNPITLPELLTTDIVLDALKKASVLSPR